MTPDTEPRPEFDLINWIKKHAGTRSEVKLGIGDDAAILAPEVNMEWVTAVDTITEGVHFTSETPPDLIGRKALAINLSDIAAMASEPVAAFVGIVLPKSRGRSYVEQLYAGIFEIAEDFGVSIAGGDTNSWDGPLVLNLTLIGTVETGKAVLRSGAKPGDWIFVTGALGGSLHSGRHLTFTPRIQEARILAENFVVTSMLDLSDGLVSDVRHLASQSGVGIVLNAESIPIHADVSTDLSARDRLHHALTDGEDFELLLTVSPAEGEKLLSQAPHLGVAVTKIGECHSGTNLKLRTKGAEIDLPQGGWGHQI